MVCTKSNRFNILNVNVRCIVVESRHILCLDSLCTYVLDIYNFKQLQHKAGREKKACFLSIINYSPVMEPHVSFLLSIIVQISICIKNNGSSLLRPSAAKHVFAVWLGFMFCLLESQPGRELRVQVGSTFLFMS